MNREHIRTILWLRWCLTRNQWRRSGSFGAILAGLALFGACAVAVITFVGGFCGAYYGLATASPDTIMWTWFGVTVLFLFVWSLGLLQELQRSETIDLQRLMHLPVALGPLFVLNYLISHVTLSIILCGPAMLGLAIGLTVTRGPAMLLLLPLALGMITMVSALTYCFRGWLAIKMADPRRRRTILMVVTITMVALAQAPQLFNLTNSHHAGHALHNYAQIGQIIKQAAGFIPPLWLPLGAAHLATHEPLTALLATAGFAGIACLALLRAYRSTIRFYHGDTGAKASGLPSSSQGKAAIPVKSDTRLLEYRIRWLPDQAVAVATMTLRSMLRAPEVKIAMGSTFLATLFFGFMLLVRLSTMPSDAAKPFILTGALAMSVFFLNQFFFNPFGFDRDGFRVFVLCPAQRHLILLGKNLACVPFAVLFGGALLLVASFRLHPAPALIAAALFQLATFILLSCGFGNVMSIYCAHRIRQGSLKPTKLPGHMVLLMLLCQLVSLPLLGTVFLSPLAGWLWDRAGWPAFVPANLLVSLGLCALAALAYHQLLLPMGRLLQRRETRILQVVVTEIE